MIATAWFTFHWLACSFVYGNASMAFLADGSRIASAPTGSRRQACGLAAAIALKRL